MNESVCGIIPDKEWLNTELQFAYQKIISNLDTFTDNVPSPASKNLQYIPEENTDWTASFWVGMLWLCWEYKQDGRIAAVIQKQMGAFQNRLENDIGLHTHDVGFLYSLSAVAAYRLTRDRRAKDMAVKAADKLMERYSETAGIFQAWGEMDDPGAQGRMIIDCNMNLPLLYFASEQTGDPKYHIAAVRHADQAKKYLVRSDGTTFHTFYMDVITGGPRFGRTHQGYSDDSCWARGQAWAIYGFALSYLHTGDISYLETACRLADYFISRLPGDWVCYWDLVFTDGDEERDSSAASIVACGLLEIAKHLPLSDPRRGKYENIALSIIRSLADCYTTKNTPQSNGLLLHAVYAKPENRGVDECCIWGDYFYLEALIRLYKIWYPYW